MLKLLCPRAVLKSGTVRVIRLLHNLENRTEGWTMQAM